MVDFRLRLRRIESEGHEPRFIIETRVVESPGTMFLGQSDQLTESEVRAKLAKEYGLTPAQVQSEID